DDSEIGRDINNHQFSPNYTNNNFSEMLTRRNIKGTNNNSPTKLKKEGYDPIPFDTIDLDENGKMYKPLRHHGNKYLAFWYQYQEYLLPLIITFVSFWTRLYLISLSNYVVWDEASTFRQGKILVCCIRPKLFVSTNNTEFEIKSNQFGSHYLKREFYFDVHPPLGKMIVGLA
ncbi:9992_t:CDS:2, partial [Acaulospora morrowiae]